MERNEMEKIIREFYLYVEGDMIKVASTKKIPAETAQKIRENKGSFMGLIIEMKKNANKEREEQYQKRMAEYEKNTKMTRCLTANADEFGNVSFKITNLVFSEEQGRFFKPEFSELADEVSVENSEKIEKILKNKKQISYGFGVAVEISEAEEKEIVETETEEIKTETEEIKTETEEIKTETEEIKTEEIEIIEKIKNGGDYGAIVRVEGLKFSVMNIFDFGKTVSIPEVGVVFGETLNTFEKNSGWKKVRDLSEVEKKAVEKIKKNKMFSGIRM